MLGAYSLISIGLAPHITTRAISIGSNFFLEHRLKTHTAFSAQDAAVDTAAVAPLPCSTKVYQNRLAARHSRAVPGIHTGFDANPCSAAKKNPPITVYDTSGP